MYDAKRHAHHLSFPTRRSSDLPPQIREHLRGPAEGPLRVDHPRRRAQPRLQAPPLAPEREPRDPPDEPEPSSGPRLIERFEQDRKSTRLNSSHLVSSYAVFCLK